MWFVDLAAAVTWTVPTLHHIPDRSMKCTTCGTSKSESATKDTYRAFLSAYRRAIVLLKHDAAGGHKLLQELAHSDVAKSLHPNHVLTLGLHLALVVSASQVGWHAWVLFGNVLFRGRVPDVCGRHSDGRRRGKDPA